MIDTREETLAKALKGIIITIEDGGKPDWEIRHIVLTTAQSALKSCGIELPGAFKFDFSEVEDGE